MSLITLDQLKKKLQWQNITKEEHTFHQDKYCLIFLVNALNHDYSSIEFCYNKAVTCFYQLSFSNWHGHFDSYEDERRNLIRAIQTARNLIFHKRCLVEESDMNGNYLGSSILKPQEIPSSISKNTRFLQRIFFNLKPIIEPVDLSRYHSGKHIFIEKKHKNEVERLCNNLDIDLPDW